MPAGVMRSASPKTHQSVALALSAHSCLSGTREIKNVPFAVVLLFASQVNTTIKFLQLEGNRIGRNGGEVCEIAA